MHATSNPRWLTIQQYAKRYSLSRTTLYKLASAGLVIFQRRTLPGRIKPMVRVEDKPPSS